MLLHLHSQLANLDSFDIDRTISLVPSEGEFALMNYRTSSGFKPPFRLYCSVDSDPASPLKALMVIKLWYVLYVVFEFVCEFLEQGPDDHQAACHTGICGEFVVIRAWPACSRRS